MFKSLKFPLVYVIEAILWLPLIATFYGLTSFLAAKPIASLDLQEKSLPPTWEAAVPNHGKFLQGYLITSHPIAFSLVLIALLASAFLLFRAHQAQVAQRKAAGPSEAKAHNIANGCVFGAIAVVGFFLVQLSSSLAVQPN